MLTAADFKAAREARGVSLLELAKLADVSYETLRAWEAGDRDPHAGTVRAVTEALSKIKLLPTL